ncbi:MAG: efflux transporter outer membrane subunit [Planctomycetota bacterium]
MPHRHGPISPPRSLGVLAALAVGACCVAVGCRVGPDYRKPAAQAVRAEYEQAKPWTAEYVDPIDCWWLQYGDPTLNGLVEEALEQNLSLREAVWRVLEARARFRTARGAWFPEASGTSDYAYRNQSENSAQFNPGGAATQAFDFYSLGFDSTWELDLFGRITRSVESAAAEAEAESEHLRDVKVTLIADVVEAYLSARSFQAQIAVAERNVALQEETLRTVRARLEAGLIGPLDAAQAESNLLSTKSTIPQLRQSLQTALNRLAFLLGTTPSDRDLIGSLADPINRFGVLATGVPAALLTQRPDIRQAEEETRAANALIGVAIADRLPIVTLRGTISAEARDASMLFESAGLAHSVGPSLRWNVLNFGRLRNVVEARKAAYYQSLIRYRQAALNAIREVEDALTAYENQQERRERLDEAVEATRRAERLSQARYEEGLVTFQRVLDTQRELAQVEGDLEASRWEVLRVIASVHRALGAGWRCPSGCEGEPLPPEACPDGYIEQSLDESIELPAHPEWIQPTLAEPIAPETPTHAATLEPAAEERSATPAETLPPQPPRDADPPETLTEPLGAAPGSTEQEAEREGSTHQNAQPRRLPPV